MTSLPAPSKDNQIGTDSMPYKLADSDVMRHRSIECHIYADNKAKLSKLIPKAPSKSNGIGNVNKQIKDIVHDTVQSLKKRLNLIRIYQRNQASACAIITKDMMWMDNKYGDGMKTSNICNRPTKK